MNNLRPLRRGFLVGAGDLGHLLLPTERPLKTDARFKCCIIFPNLFIAGVIHVAPSVTCPDVCNVFSASRSPSPTARAVNCDANACISTCPKSARPPTVCARRTACKQLVSVKRPASANERWTISERSRRNRKGLNSRSRRSLHARNLSRGVLGCSTFR
jgi:hypothetical protein